jgi:hypothetical protein
MRKRLIALAVALLLPTLPASAAVITFDGLRTPSAFTTPYTESGFNVSPVSNDWIVWTSYGNPAPAIVFFNPDTTVETSAQVEVTAGGGLFTFQGVDLYSSLTPIPFVFVGLLNSTVVLNQSGTVPNTFGNFRAVSANSTQPIDTLRITVVNPSTAPFGGRNPAGLDNIVVNRVPEPATMLLMSAGLAVVVRRRLQRR